MEKETVIGFKVRHVWLGRKLVEEGKGHEGGTQYDP